MERIFYAAGTTDPVTQLPIYLFDTSFLPPTDDIDYEQFIPVMLQALPRTPFCLIMFSLGLNKISWMWGVKFLKRFLSDKRNVANLQKMVTVHDSWFVKSLTQILTNYHVTVNSLSSLNKYIDVASSNIVELFAAYNAHHVKLITCSSLSQLSHYFDISKLKISLNVYRHDHKLGPLELAMRYTPLVNPYTRVNSDTHPVFYHHLTQLLVILRDHGTEVELLWHRPGNKTSSDILYQCLNRNQLLWINDWDIYCIGTVYKRILAELSSPLVPAPSIPLPMDDSEAFTVATYRKIHQAHVDAGSGFERLLYATTEMCWHLQKSRAATRHSLASVAKCMAHCLSHEGVSRSNDAAVAVVTRMMAQMITYWPEIVQQVSVEPLTPLDTAPVEPDGPPLPPRRRQPSINDSYNMSFDLTINDHSTDDEDDLIDLDDSVVEPHAPDSVQGSHAKSVKSAKSVSSLAEPERKPGHARARSIPNDETSDVLAPLTPKRPFQSSPTTAQSQFSRISSTSNSSLSSVDSELASAVMAAKKKLSDVSNIALDLPNHKYRVADEARPAAQPKPSPPPVPAKKPVIRGRKVGELAKLFEERCQGLEILRTL
ncbi:protein Ecm25p [Diutina catenulata]